LRRTQAQHIREKDAVSERVSARSANSPLGVPFKTVLASNMQGKQRARGSGQQPQPPAALNRAEISRWTSRAPRRRDGSFLQEEIEISDEKY
jgi:hypothetical protein